MTSKTDMRRRTTSIIILAVFLYLNSSQILAESTECFGVGEEEPGAHLKVDNRFEHCRKGDVITVYTKSLDNTEGKAIDLNAFSMRVNEVTKFCDFKHDIVLIGETQLPNNGLTTRWFSCVYLGEKRNSRFRESHE